MLQQLKQVLQQKYAFIFQQYAILYYCCKSAIEEQQLRQSANKKHVGGCIANANEAPQFFFNAYCF